MIVYIIIYGVVTMGTSFLGNPVYAAKKVKVEDSIDLEVKRLAPLIQITNTSQSQTTTGIAAVTSPSETLGPNLIPNPTLDSANTSGMPVGWNKGGYGSNSRVFNYPVSGNTDSKAIQVLVTNYVSGDAKWFFNDVTVSPGQTYQFTNYSLSNVTSTITMRYKLTDGTFIYKDVMVVGPTSTYQKNTVRVTIPSGVTSLTVFHLIQANGSLSTDDYSLNQITSAVQTGNIVENGNFETIGGDGSPVNWLKGGWGTNTRIFTYPVSSPTNSTAAKVAITSFSNGDAKWYFKPVAITPGIYTYSDQTISDVPSTITAQFFNLDGTISYKDLVKLPASAALTSTSLDFAVGSEVAKITIFHLIQSQGNLTIDNVSVTKKSDPVGIFKTGAVTLRFDDGWLSEYQNAIPKMNSLGIKGTFYIVSNQKAEDGYPAFMNISQIREIYNMGNEIGAHTRTHPYLSQLSQADQQSEIVGSRNDLLSLNVGQISSFAYPFGDYNSTTLSIVKNAGFTNAISTIDGPASQLSDVYQLERFGLTASTTLSQVKQAIDNAQAQKKWLILTFHEIDTNGHLYSVTPQLFGQILDYIVSKNMPIVTASEGAIPP